MANHEHLEILKQGVEVWNKWRKDNSKINPDLSEADIEALNFSGINFHRTMLIGAKLGTSSLCGADLSYASLQNAFLMGADLTAANLVNSDLSGANCSMADLIGADLSFAELSYVNFSESDIERSNFYKSVLYCTVFADVDFSTVKSLETVRHHGPSSIGIDTLYKSQGKIPDVFLRGCGVPDQMIEYAMSLTNIPIQYYSCFISYSTQDDAFASRLHADLQAKGVRCWFAPHDMQSGKKVYQQIDEAIRVYDKLLLILSDDSMRSNWVGSEIIKAKKKEDKRGTQMLFPIGIVPFEKVKCWEFFDSDSGRDLAREIRDYHIPDFSTWKTDHDSYQKAFVHLLRDLQLG